jgi:hypothetical protein
MSIASAANAIVIDLAPSNNFYQTYSQDGFTFTNSKNSFDALGNWVHLPGQEHYNASNSNGGLFVNYGGTTTDLTATAGGTFKFESIGLADVYNQLTGGDVSFSFFGLGGSLISSTTVTLLSGIAGLQTFNFNIAGVERVSFTAISTYGEWVQFDNVAVNGVASGVPEPSTWAMMLLGFAGLGYAGYRKRKALPATA